MVHDDKNAGEMEVSLMKEKDWDLGAVIRCLDKNFPDTGAENPYFGLQLVLLSAAMFGTTDIYKLSNFIGCAPAYVAAVATNMLNNGLWDAYGCYDCSAWF